MFTSILPLQTILELQRKIALALLENNRKNEMLQNLAAPKRRSQSFNSNATRRQVRSDAELLRRQAKNVYDGKIMAEKISSAGGKILSSLGSMRELADNVAAGATGGGASGKYQAYANSIDEVVRSTSHMGLSLMDSKQWKSPRIQVEGGGKASIAFEEAGLERNIKLTDYSGLTSGLSPATDLNSAAAASAASAILAAMINTIKNSQRSYSSLAGKLDSEASNLNTLADCLDESAGGNQGNSTVRLSDYMLSDQGKLIDHSL